MISYLKGTVFVKTGDMFVVVNNGLGYEIMTSSILWRKFNVGDEVEIYTHEYIREDARDLYGFGSLLELSFFRKLISISGVGPKVALRVLSIGTLRDLEEAIGKGNVGYLTAIPGIGQKTAQKIVIELKGRLDLSEDSGAADRDTLEALQSLGYSSAQAREALKNVSPEVDEVGDRVRAALKVLGGKK